MTPSSKSMLKRSILIAIAIIGFLVLSAMGKYAIFYIHTHWACWVTCSPYIYIGCYYLVFFVAQYPATVLAAIVIRASPVAQPRLTTCVILFAITMSAFLLGRNVNQPWIRALLQMHRIPPTAQVASIFILPPVGVLRICFADRRSQSRIRSECGNI